MVREVTDGYRVLAIDDVSPLAVVNGTLQWRPLRRTLDVRAFGINAYTAANVGSFFTAFFYVRFSHPEYPFDPQGIFEIPKATTGINTAILVGSSFTMHWALVSIRRGKRFGLIAGLALTLIMGLTFLSLQMREYHSLGFVPSDGAFSTTFFALTGLHGLHVFVGATLLAIALLRACRGHYSPDEHLGLEVTGLYWHFVDVVWIFLYTVVYLL